MWEGMEAEVGEDTEAWALRRAASEGHVFCTPGPGSLGQRIAQLQWAGCGPEGAGCLPCPVVPLTSGTRTT